MKKIIQLLTVTALSAACFTGCESMSNTPKGTITKSDFGTSPDGKPVELYTLANSKGMTATIMTYGGIVTSLKVPDKDGNFGDVVLGYDNLDSYVKSSPYFGALIGRYGNRIAAGKFTLDDTTYQLATNNGVNSLHGGLKGFDKVVWTSRPMPTTHGPSLILTYVSPGMEEGYPGTLSVTAIYSLTEDNELKLEYSATTSAKTVVNLTHHSYFNLAGKGDILNHVAIINADKFTPVDATLIPTGELRPVQGTPFDFTTPHTIGERIGNTNDEQIARGNGYDHNFVLNKKGNELSFAAEIYEVTSGRILQVYSTEPGIQFYSGNFLDGTLTGKGGWTYQFRDGFCLEPQHFPDSPNHPEFPTVVLNPGETYHNTIIYKFSVKK
ncbi:MAG TPA: aldose epimerase family protein [Candidatus Sulfotelmatobacter sp.]|jgi:aldose 1-epimerase|nr:aldose epimerase family protein [Candidatus Sulfotelmatobacter sp.]